MHHLKRAALVAAMGVALSAGASGAAQAAKYHVDVLPYPGVTAWRPCSFIDASSFKDAFDKCQRKFGLTAPAAYVVETYKKVCKSTHKVTLASNQSQLRFVYDKRFSFYMRPDCP